MMTVSQTLFSSVFLWVMLLFGVGFFMVALWLAPWRALLQKTERQHALFAAWISLILLMQLSVTWVDGVALHFLAMTSIVVIFGWSLALLIGAAAQLTMMIWQADYTLVIGVNYLLSVVVPASVAYVVFRGVLRLKSNNLFFFLLGGGFFGSMITLLASVAVMLLFLLINQQMVILEKLYSEGLIVVLLCYSEGFLNGMIVTAVTVFFPGIVKTFDEQKYLDS